MSDLELVVGDCRQALPVRFAEEKARLLIADPPYNYGEPYDKCQDNLSWGEYMKFTKEWLYQAARALHKHGSMFLFYPDELVSFVDVYCQEELGLFKRGHIIWFYTFGVCNAGGKNFSRSHTHVLYLVKTESKFTFNDEGIRVESARAAVYKDKRANAKGKVPDNTWVLLKKHLEPLFKPDMDTWLESRICGTYHEREQASPNQLPLPLVERIILATSNPGDLVCDPFVGSGTTTVAALKHGRKSWGCDVSKNYITNIKRRLAHVDR